MQQQSSLGLASMILGFMGLGFVVMSCCANFLLFPGILLSGLGLLLGFLELQKVNQGTAPEENRGQAMAGMGSGGAGCALGALWAVLCVVFFALYIVFIVFVSIIGNA